MSFYKKSLKNKVSKLYNQLDETIKLKTILDLWNNPTPHFGGSGPHRYEGASKTCCYCNRPKDWKPCNTGLLAMEIVESE